ncbi:MAG TPA: AAA-associated domain-containing protein, partial [Streptosporangiaceae bacterium]|nr:AAA-associated domain-containing protein [Streptosporangiaceae bacterium]
MTGPLISVRALSKSFARPDGRPVPVLDGVTLAVEEGEFVALLGRSGSGKSTLLRCIAGLIAPTDGEVLFRGRPLTGCNRDTTMVFQTFALLPWLTVQQNVELGLEARGVAPGERYERALRAIDLVGLDGYESAYPKELSGGMRQRVGFARALVVEPAALLMDEPFSALDVLTSENLRGELLELWEGQRFPTKTMIMVTHNIEEAVLLADRLLVLGSNPGRIRADMPNPLPRPRRRRTPEFEELVDQLYRMMTHRDQVTEARPAQPGGAGPGRLGESPLPQATVDGLSGLAEILLGRHEGAADLADLADNLGLEVDHLLPLVDALVLLGFARLDGDLLELTAGGRVFAGASIQDSKMIFARTSLERAPLVRTIFRALRGSLDGNLPAGFFTDVLRTSVGEDEAARQLDVAVNWGRYAELYAYDATSGQIIREKRGIGATLDDPPEPARRGALHLFLGAAPGTGKTFTMLREGRALRDRGEDVVIGFVQTRGRPRTAEAIGGLEIVPRRPPSGPASGVAGVVGDPGEMDLDAVLARRPAVVLVDDYGQHLQAIAALRDAGIDVLSTVDVCDLDRAADAVRQMTGQSATPTVPDAALAEADDIRFVDSSPEALRKRLGHGNIYPAAQAEKALKGLFSTANLAALREIGLQVVAETLTTPRAATRREPPGVLVAVTAADQAGALLQRGLRLARPAGAACAVLPIGLPPRAAGAVRQVADDAGVTVLAREGSDAAAMISQVVHETGARHLVLAASATIRRDRWPARLVWRWPPSLAERLADQLSEVHLHITALEDRPAGEHGAGARPDTRPGEPGAPREQRRGTVRVYLGYAAGCGVTTAMLEEAGRRRSRGSDVVVAAVDCRGREAVHAVLEGLELIGDGTALDTGAVLARRPEVVCIDDLSVTDVGGENRFDGARRLAEAGITVVATVHLGSMRGHGGPLDEAAVLAFADELELVDVPPSVLADRVRRGELGPADGTEEALRTSYAPEMLEALREQAFSIVAEHADRRLAAYRSGGSTASSQAPPVILACAAPEPGMEPLIRGAAALAARLAGNFLVAAVVPAPPSPGLEPVLAGYAALAAQLGGQFAALHGTPAAALTAFADEHQVTEMLLARSTPDQAGHHPVLRELAR